MTKEKQTKDKKENSGPLVSQDIPTKFEYGKPIKLKRPQSKKKSGIVLEDKYAKLIRARKKKEIISTENFKNYSGKEIFLCGKSIYGSIILNEPMKLDRCLLKNHSKRHLITNYDVDRLWPEEKTFYSYSFRITKMFKNPVRYKYTNATFGIVDNIEFKNKKETPEMKDLQNLNKDNTVVEKEQTIQEELKVEEILQSNSRLDKYYNKLNNLKAINFGGRYKDIAQLFLNLYELYLEKSNSKIYDKNGVVLKPVPDVTENYIRIRIRDPKTIVEGSFRTIIISASQGIKAVIGKLKSDPNGSTKVQSVLFDKKKWDTKRATTWVREHREDLKSLDSDDLKEKKADNTEKNSEVYVDSDYIPRDKDTGKQEEKWIWCCNCKNSFDYYKQLLDDKSTVLCPHCGALVTYEEKE